MTPSIRSSIITSSESRQTRSPVYSTSDTVQLETVLAFHVQGVAGGVRICNQVFGGNDDVVVRSHYDVALSGKEFLMTEEEENFLPNF